MPKQCYNVCYDMFGSLFQLSKCVLTGKCTQLPCFRPCQADRCETNYFRQMKLCENTEIIIGNALRNQNKNDFVKMLLLFLIEYIEIASNIFFFKITIEESIVSYCVALNKIRHKMKQKKQ